MSDVLLGLTAFVTGAASGMGLATAQLLGRQGARVAVTDVSAEGAAAAAEAMREEGLAAHAWRLDVADPDEIVRVVEEIVSRFGGLDILVNNAGVSGFAALGSESYEAVWERSMAILLTCLTMSVVFVAGARIPAPRPLSGPCSRSPPLPCPAT